MKSENALLRLRPSRPADPAPAAPNHDEAAYAAYAQWLESLRADLALTFQGVAIRGARRYTLNPTSSTRPTTSSDTLVGWSIRETTGAAGATVIFRDGHDANGEEIAAVTLVAGESARDWFGPGGISVGPEGLFVQLLTGAVAGSVFLGGVE